MKTPDNSFDFEEAPSQGASLERLRVLAKEAIATEHTIISMEEGISEFKRRLNAIKTTLIPDAMAELGLSEFKTDDGFKFTMDDFVSGSLPKDQEARAAAMDWLEANGANSLIKTEVSLSFGRNEHNQALSLTAELSERGFPVTRKTTVHPQTLLAYARERLHSGDELPLELLGLYAGRIVKIKQQKGK